MSLIKQRTDEEKEIENAKKIDNQVINYDKLGVIDSKRGQAALVVCGLMILTVVLYFFDLASADNLYSLIIYLPLAFFIYKGRRWAMFSTIVVWSLDKGYQLIEGQSRGFTFMWWIIVVGIVYNAIEVENEKIKRNIKKADRVIAKEDIIDEEEKNKEAKEFCNNCGKELIVASNFCKFCGNKLI